MTIAIQHKRGVAANRPTLASGEMYFATDSNQVFMGPTPIQIGAPVVATSNLTAQHATIATTTLWTPAATGCYRVSLMLKVTTPATTSCTLGPVTIGYTSGDDNVIQSCLMVLQTATGTTVTANSINTAQNVMNGDIFIFAKAGNVVSFAVTYASSGATAMVFALHARAEFIG